MKITKAICLLALLGVTGCATDGVIYYDTSPSYYYYTYPRHDLYIWPEWDHRGYRAYWYDEHYHVYHHHHY